MLYVAFTTWHNYVLQLHATFTFERIIKATYKIPNDNVAIIIISFYLYASIVSVGYIRDKCIWPFANCNYFAWNDRLGRTVTHSDSSCRLLSNSSTIVQYVQHSLSLCTRNGEWRFRLFVDSIAARLQFARLLGIDRYFADTVQSVQ